MFAVRCNFSPITSYAQAVKAWNLGIILRKLRNVDGAPRMLAARKKHMTVQRTEAEDIILRLYEHPVVTWHKDNSLTIQGHTTRSTVVFANRCTPDWMFAQVYGGYFTISVHGRTYKVSDRITFRERDNTWKADQVEPWSLPVVNRERAAQALADIGYREFRDWLKVYVQMAAVPPVPGKYVSNEDVINLLRSRMWRELTTHFPDAWHNSNRVLQELRQAVYREYDCIECKSVPFLG